MSNSKQRQPTLETRKMVGSQQSPVEPTKELNFIDSLNIADLLENTVGVDYGDPLLSQPLDVPISSSFPSPNTIVPSDLDTELYLDQLFPLADSNINSSDLDSWDLETLLTA